MSAAMFAELAAAFVPPLTGRLVERGMPHGPVTIEGRFATRETAEAAAQRYLRCWHPLGYGTHLAIRQDGEQWVVYGGRADSCE